MKPVDISELTLDQFAFHEATWSGTEIVVAGKPLTPKVFGVDVKIPRCDLSLKPCVATADGGLFFRRGEDNRALPPPVATRPALP